MQRLVLVALVVVALIPLAVLAQEQHEQTSPLPEQAWEILSGDGRTIRLDRVSGATAWLSGTDRGEPVWNPLAHPNPAARDGNVRYQLVLTNRSRNQWLLLDLRDGQTWFLRNSTNPLRPGPYWVPVSVAPDR